MKNRLMNKPKMLLIVASICFGVLFLAFILCIALLVFGKAAWLLFVFALALPASGGFLYYAINNYIENKQMLETLQIENKYQLGIGNYFFNYQMFKNRVKKLRKSHDLEKEYVIAFTVNNILNITKVWLSKDF